MSGIYIYLNIFMYRRCPSELIELYLRSSDASVVSRPRAVDDREHQMPTGMLDLPTSATSTSDTPRRLLPTIKLGSLL